MSNDSTMLTVYNLKNSSLMSIQCEASNINGLVFAQGYLNVSSESSDMCVLLLIETFFKRTLR